MAKLIKSSLTGWQKAVLGIVLLADLAHLALQLAGSKSLGLFLMLGIVPGSEEHRLAPNTVILMCVVVFVVIFLLIFGGNIIRLFRRPKHELTPVGISMRALSYYLPSSQHAIQESVSRRYPARAAQLRRVGYLAALRLTLLNGISTTRQSVAKWRPVVAYRAVQAARVAEQFARVVAHYSVVAAKAFWRDAKRFWHFSEPYLRQIDKHIEARLRKALGLPTSA